MFTSEWNMYSQKTYRANYACNHEIAGDITKISERDIPHHDILLAGFPCQPFSIAGVSKKISLGLKHGFACETQGNLFFDVARIIRYHRPRCFLLENVKNLVSHDRGRTFSIIRNVLEHELGYCLHWRIIDGKGFVPQHRERIFIVGFLDKNDFSFDTLSLPDPLSGPRLSAILHPEKTVVKNRKATIPWEKRPLFPKNTRYPTNYGNICKTMLTSTKRRETVLVLDCAIMTVWPEHCRHAITRTGLKSLSHRDTIKTRDG